MSRRRPGSEVHFKTVLEFRCGDNTAIRLARAGLSRDGREVFPSAVASGTPWLWKVEPDGRRWFSETCPSCGRLVVWAEAALLARLQDNKAAGRSVEHLVH